MGGWGGSPGGSTSSPGTASFGTVQPKTLPGGEPVPESAIENLEGCNPFALFREVRYDQWKGARVGGVSRRAWALSDRVADGYYWWVLAAAMHRDEGSNFQVNLHLVPPGFGPVATTNVDDPFFTVAGNSPPTIASVLVSIGGASPSNEQTANLASVLGAKKFPFPVPPGWALMAWEETSAGSAIIHGVILRVAYLKLPLSVEPPVY